MAPQGPPQSLHDLAVDAQNDIHKLATGLAHAGAAPQAVQQLTQMGEVLAQVVKVLAEGPSLDRGAGQPGEQAEPGEPPPGQPPAPQGGPPPGQMPMQGGPPPGQMPMQGGPPPPHEQAAKASLQSATHALHAAMITSKSQRAGQ